MTAQICPDCNSKTLSAPSCKVSDQGTEKMTCSNCGWQEGFPLTFFVMVHSSRIMRVFAADMKSAKIEANRQMRKSNRWKVGKFEVIKAFR